MMETTKDQWVPFDPLWVIQAIDHPISLDPVLKGEPELVEQLKAKLRAVGKVLIRQNPENQNHVIFYFHNPVDSGWAIASSINIYGEEADFLVNLLPGGGLAALQVWYHENRLAP